MTSDEIELLKFQNKYLAETLLLVVQDLTRASMSEYQPDYFELLELSKWAYGVFEMLGIDKTKLEIYTQEV